MWVRCRTIRTFSVPQILALNELLQRPLRYRLVHGKGTTQSIARRVMGGERNPGKALAPRASRVKHGFDCNYHYCPHSSMRSTSTASHSHRSIAVIYATSPGYLTMFTSRWKYNDVYPRQPGAQRSSVCIFPGLRLKYLYVGSMLDLYSRRSGNSSAESSSRLPLPVVQDLLLAPN